ncbi:hypothetical protein [Streptomyces afghaniensis]|uniref:hypothetical protein n=1 Tax=Streptomyces afghaniensis TaxID=66865 RepID=UPI00278925A8|nr:hypothetical protein [Streptomyces afghaniensis]MDQ1022012.1 hypothetical protein [Streptomyces afghaniensis]
MRRRGRDVILLGFEERSASIMENAQTAKAAIMHANAERDEGRCTVELRHEDVCFVLR